MRPAKPGGYNAWLSVDGEPMAGKLKANTLKAKDEAEQGDKLPKKKCKVVSKETIKESEEDSKAEAEEANKWFKTEWTQALWVISNEMCLMRKAQEKTANECTKIAENVAFLVSDIDLVMDRKRYIRTHSHGPVDGKVKEPPFGTKVGPKGEAEKPKVVVEELKDTAEEADIDMTMKE